MVQGEWERCPGGSTVTWEHIWGCWGLIERSSQKRIKNTKEHSRVFCPVVDFPQKTNDIVPWFMFQRWQGLNEPFWVLWETTSGSLFRPWLSPGLACSSPPSVPRWMLPHSQRASWPFQPFLPTIIEVQTYPLLSAAPFSTPHFWSCLVAQKKDWRLKPNEHETPALWTVINEFIKKEELVTQFENTCIESISDVSNQLCVLSHLDVWYASQLLTSYWSFYFFSFWCKWFGSRGSSDWRHVRYWQSSDNTCGDNGYVHAPLLPCYSLFNLGLQG